MLFVIQVNLVNLIEIGDQTINAKLILNILELPILPLNKTSQSNT